MLTENTLIRLGRCPGCSESLLGAYVILLVFCPDAAQLLLTDHVHTVSRNTYKSSRNEGVTSII